MSDLKSWNPNSQIGNPLGKTCFPVRAPSNKHGIGTADPCLCMQAPQIRGEDPQQGAPHYYIIRKFHLGLLNEVANSHRNGGFFRVWTSTCLHVMPKGSSNA